MSKTKRPPTVAAADGQDRTHLKPTTIQRIRITREGHFMSDFNPQKETRPHDPPEVQRMRRRIISAGIEHTIPTLQNDFERTIFQIAVKSLDFAEEIAA